MESAQAPAQGPHQGETVHTCSFHTSPGWGIFFCAVTVIVITTMMLPQLFGMHNFVQWGGMYVNRRCSVQLSGVDLETGGGERRRVARPFNPPVFYYPMHNRETCVAWARLHYCGKTISYDSKLLRFRIAEVYPELAWRLIFRDENVCSRPPDETLKWFSQEDL